MKGYGVSNASSRTTSLSGGEANGSGLAPVMERRFPPGIQPVETTRSGSYWPSTARYATGPTVSRNKLAALPNFPPLAVDHHRGQIARTKGGDVPRRLRARETIWKLANSFVVGENVADDRDGRTILFGSRRSLESEDSVVSRRLSAFSRFLPFNWKRKRTG